MVVVLLLLRVETMLLHLNLQNVEANFMVYKDLQMQKPNILQLRI